MSGNGTGSVALLRVWKKFRYGEIHNRLRDLIPAMVRRVLGRRPSPNALWEGEFWALRDVSFEVGPGDALGIIGPNGAGKSTILRLLTRIMRPTRGSCRARGRIGALIEVTAGFHPDLTGRENIYLQGAVMGMTRREITRKFDEIVAFSGVELFLDTPVKRYSSGMHTRLGFSIAAHVDPDVLLVDEVLTVGDAAFQAKAFERVSELVRQDIAVVVVSHQLEAISALCNTALLLDRGRVVRTGSPQECIAAYLSGAIGVRPPTIGDGAVRIESMALTRDVVTSGSQTDVELSCQVREDGWSEPESVRVCVRRALTGETVFESGTFELNTALPRSGAFTLTFSLHMNVPPGIYMVQTLVWDRLMTRVSFVGPSCNIEVRGGTMFTGVAQLNPRVELHANSVITRPES